MTAIGRRDRARRLAAFALAALGIVVFVSWVSRTTTAPLSPQSRFNVGFAGIESFERALDVYPKYWTPLYPSLLWAADRAGVTAAIVDRGLFCVTLFLVWAIVRAHMPGIRPTYPVLLLVVAHFHHHNLHQHVSEHLVAPLALLLLWLMLRTNRADWSSTVALAVTTAALCLARYVSLFWPAPLAAIHLATAGALTARGRTARLAVLLVVAAIPIGAWMAFSWIETGFLTGIDRDAPRYGRERTTLLWNVVFFGRTLVLDFLSPATPATHVAVWLYDSVAMVELALLLLLGASISASVAACRRGPSGPDVQPDGRTLAWLAAFALSYPVVLVALSTVGNNDPIYTRFLYPWYPFLTLLAFAIYAWTRDRAPSGAVCLPWRILYAGIIGVQSARLLRDVLAAS